MNSLHRDAFYMTASQSCVSLIIVIMKLKETHKCKITLQFLQYSNDNYNYYNYEGSCRGECITVTLHSTKLKK